MKFENLLKLVRYRELDAVAKGRLKRRIIYVTAFSFLISSIVFAIYRTFFSFLITFISIIIFIALFIKIRIVLKKSARIHRIESVFPDFLQLMSSNLRAGMTIDRALLLSSRPEFAPLDEEILKTGKEITVGKSMVEALVEFSNSIGSPKIEKVILLINSGINSGGNLAVLLEETSRSMREREVLEKKATSSILMYIIFIFLIVSIFAPGLFSLSNVLVEILTRIFAGLPDIETTANVPFVLSKVNVSINFIKYFSVLFIVVIDLFSVLILGLIIKGEEKQGFRYFLPILIVSLGVFFIFKAIISNFMDGFF